MIALARCSCRPRPQEELPHGTCFAALHGAPDGYLRVALAAELMNTPFFISSVGGLKYQVQHFYADVK